MPIDGGFVGMVDREQFDEWLRAARGRRPARARRTGTLRAPRARRRRHVASCTSAARDGAAATEPMRAVRAARDRRRRRRSRGGAPVRAGRRPACRYVFAYHEIVRAPAAGTPGYDGTRCDVYLPRHRCRPTSTAGSSRTATRTSVGTGSAAQGLLAAHGGRRLRARAGLATAETDPPRGRADPAEAAAPLGQRPRRGAGRRRRRRRGAGLGRGHLLRDDRRAARRPRRSTSS